VRRDEGEFQELAPYGAAVEAPARARGRSSLAHVESDVPEIRPRRIGELLDVATEVFRARFVLYVALATALWVPVKILQPILLPDDRFAGRGTVAGATFLVAFAATLFPTLVVTALVNATVARLVASELGGRATSIPAAIRGVLARSFAILVLVLVNSATTALGFMCMCIPGIFALFKLYLAPAICVIEDAGIVESLSRSAQLPRGRFLAWFGIFVVATLLLFPFTSMAGALEQPGFKSGALQRFGISPLAYDWARVAFTSLFTGVATAFHGVMVTVWYFDCRARHEGADLAARLERLRADVAGSPRHAPGTP
jgi:hypothetical protein